MNVFKIIGIAAAAAAAAAAAGLAATNPGNSAETREDEDDENLRPRRFPTTLDRFVAETEKLVPTLTTYGRNWKFISTEKSADAALLKAEVPVFIFTDDLKIRAEALAADEVLVNVHSAARIGANDLGENRRHLLQILKILDEKFSANAERAKS